MAANDNADACDCAANNNAANDNSADEDLSRRASAISYDLGRLTADLFFDGRLDALAAFLRNGHT